MGLKSPQASVYNASSKAMPQSVNRRSAQGPERKFLGPLDGKVLRPPASWELWKAGSGHDEYLSGLNPRFRAGLVN